MPMSAYDLDLHAWAREQAEALRRRSANEIDWENVAEEIESLGKQQVAELRSRLEVLIVHLLKWIYQPERRGRGWLLTIAEQRFRVREHIAENSSLKAVREDVFRRAYEGARYSAARTIRRSPATFPTEAPFSLQEALTEDWLPQPAFTTDEPAG
jgi:hypothetical protein